MSSAEPPGDDPAPSVEALDLLSTEELRRRAFERAEERRDVGFIWDLMRHLPPADDPATEDASAGSLTGSLAEAMELVRELMGRGLGDREPLVRARFIAYLHNGD